MQKDLELTIRNRLLGGEDPEAILRSLFEKVIDEGAPAEEIKTLMSFAVNSGLHAVALELMALILRLEKPLPWGVLLQIFITQGLKPTESMIKNLFSGANAQGGIPDLVINQDWDHVSSAFKGFREKVAAERLEAQERLKSELFTKLEFSKQQGLIDEERKLLQKLERLLPENPQIQDAKKEFQERWSHEVISRRSAHIRDRHFWQKIARDPLTDEVAETLFKGASKKAKESPHCAYDLALLFVFLDYPRHALDIISVAPIDLKVKWLRLELLILADRNIEALDYALALEADHSSDPDVIFATSYARARAMYALGQSGLAVELLQSILKIRPQYRSAHSLLTSWQGGEP